MDPAPPLAPREPATVTLHGDVRTDDYAWLRNREDPRVLDYLRAENAYTDAVMAHTKPLQEALYREILSHIQETDVSPPTRIDDWLYYRRTEEGKQYRTYCRRRATAAAPEQVILDQNALAEGHDYHALGVFAVSEDHRLLAYSEDVTGRESYTIRVKDLETGELLPDEIPGTSYGLAWANDGRSFYYTVHDEAMRSYRLCRHVLGRAPRDDEVLYEEEDEHFWVRIHKTRTKRFVVVTSASMVTSEVRLLDADAQGPPRLVEPRRQEVEYYLEHQGDRFLVLTNEEARNFRLMEAPVDDPSRARWREIVPHRPDVKLAEVEAFADHLVLVERHEGLTRLRVWKRSSGEEHLVEMPEPVYGAWVGENPTYQTSVLRFQYTSLVTPVSWFDYDLDSRERTLVKRQPVPGYDPSGYVSERRWATASDGTRIPVSLVYRKGTRRDGSNPCLLTGYGAYGASFDPFFSPLRIPLLERGFVCAIAHVRGGGELGEPWHDAGKMLAKRNTFTDFIACAELLVAEGYTRPDRLVIEGGSAGGLLVGAVTNMRPDLFAAVVAEVPFVDVLNTICDPSLPLTVTEWEEWGNPLASPEHYHYIKSYSPYDNVEPKAYPHLLVLAGLNDRRVHYWEPAKWVAKLRATKTDSNRLLLKTWMETGHAGPSGRYDAYREAAFTQAFILDVLGLAPSG